MEPKYGYQNIGRKDYGVSTLDLLTGEKISATTVRDPHTGRLFTRNQNGELFCAETGQWESFTDHDPPTELIPGPETKVVFARPRGPTGEEWLLDTPTDTAHKFNQPAPKDFGFV